MWLGSLVPLFVYTEVVGVDTLAASVSMLVSWVTADCISSSVFSDIFCGRCALTYFLYFSQFVLLFGK